MAVTVIDVGLNFGYMDPLEKESIDAVVLHHADASSATVEDIHRWHLENGWAGIGYHYYVRKNGSIYRGRPEDKEGAHARASSGYNKRSLGICFEGRYEVETMPAAQLTAGRALIGDIEYRFRNRLQVLRHSDVTTTVCPGARFPYAAMKNYIIVQEDRQVYIIYNTINDIPEWGKPTVEKLIAKGYLNGEGENKLNLEYYMLRSLVINDRAGLYGEA